MDEDDKYKNSRLLVEIARDEYRSGEQRYQLFIAKVSGLLVASAFVFPFAFSDTMHWLQFVNFCIATCGFMYAICIILMHKGVHRIPFPKLQNFVKSPAPYFNQTLAQNLQSCIDKSAPTFNKMVIAFDIALCFFLFLLANRLIQKWDSVLLYSILLILFLIVIPCVFYKRVSSMKKPDSSLPNANTVELKEIPPTHDKQEVPSGTNQPEKFPDLGTVIRLDSKYIKNEKK